MKICYIASLGSTHTERWMNYFAEAGHEVHLIDTGELSAVGIEDIRLHQVKKICTSIRIIDYLINPIPFVIQFSRILKNMRPDVIHAHSITDLTILSAINLFHPFVFTAWGSDILILPKKSKIFKWIVKNVIKSADMITCDAEHLTEPLVQFGADQQKINLIYFGVDTRKFNQWPKDEKLLRELGILGSPTIISLRRLRPIYDIGTLITAMSMVLMEVPEAKLVIAGTGSQEAELKELAKSLDVLGSVIFVGWIPNDDELSKYLVSADIYVSTSLSDAGLAASTAEAMACGLPVIITDFGDNRKWVEDGVNGFVIPLRDPRALAEKIIYLLKNEDVRKEFGMINRKIIEDRNDYYKEMGKMENIYKKLIGGHNS